MLWLVGSIVGLIGIAILHSAYARRRVVIAAHAVPLTVSRKIIELIDAAGAANADHQVLLRPLPSAEPVRRDPGLLASIALASPPLPSAWSGRSLSFRAAEDELHVQCGPTSSESMLNGSKVEPIRLPPGTSDGEDDWSAYSGRSLCERVPQLRSMLAPYGAKVEQIVEYLLVGEVAPDTFNVTLMGRQPELIQAEHDAKCPVCNSPMRFLLSTGAFGSTLKGDAPVAYVYGCDVHLEVRAFVDIH